MIHKSPRISTNLSPIETLRWGVSFVLARARLSNATLFRLGVMACTLLTFGLGFLLWDRFPFREDEAIYAYWALHFARIDPWFLTVWPDKPPLFLWSLAGVFELFGPSPASARLLNMTVTALTVPVVAAHRPPPVGTRRRAVGRGSPLPSTPSSSASPPRSTRTPCWCCGAWSPSTPPSPAAPFGPGIFLGAAIMTKQQGVLFVPLIWDG